MNEPIMQAVVILSTVGSSKAQNTQLWLDVRPGALSYHATGAALTAIPGPARSIAGSATAGRRPFG
jgi:hypothetical protein